jgi:hypothetical protein
MGYAYGDLRKKTDEVIKILDRGVSVVDVNTGTLVTRYVIPEHYQVGQKLKYRMPKSTKGMPFKLVHEDMYNEFKKDVILPQFKTSGELSERTKSYMRGGDNPPTRPLFTNQNNKKKINKPLKTSESTKDDKSAIKFTYHDTSVATSDKQDYWLGYSEAPLTYQEFLKAWERSSSPNPNNLKRKSNRPSISEKQWNKMPPEEQQYTILKNWLVPLTTSVNGAEGFSTPGDRFERQIGFKDYAYRLGIGDISRLLERWIKWSGGGGSNIGKVGQLTRKKRGIREPTVQELRKLINTTK